MDPALRSLTDLEVDAFLSQLRASAVVDLTISGYDAAEAALLADLQITAAFPTVRRLRSIASAASSVTTN